MSAQTHKGIVIPADQVVPCRLVELPNDHHAERAALEGLVGGPVERVRYDVDAQLYVHQEGALLPLPVNSRATAYAMRDSEAACRIAEGVGPAARPYDLHGDVVLVGTPATIEDLENQDVPPRFHAIFLTWVASGRPGGPAMPVAARPSRSRSRRLAPRPSARRSPGRPVSSRLASLADAGWLGAWPGGSKVRHPAGPDG